MLFHTSEPCQRGCPPPPPHPPNPCIHLVGSYLLPKFLSGVTLSGRPPLTIPSKGKLPICFLQLLSMHVEKFFHLPGKALQPLGFLSFLVLSPPPPCLLSLSFPSSLHPSRLSHRPPPAPPHTSGSQAFGAHFGSSDTQTAWLPQRPMVPPGKFPQDKDHGYPVSHRLPSARLSTAHSAQHAFVSTETCLWTPPCHSVQHPWGLPEGSSQGAPSTPNRSVRTSNESSLAGRNVEFQPHIIEASLRNENLKAIPNSVLFL